MFSRFIFFPLVLLLAACSGNSTKPFSYWKEPVTGIEFVLVHKGIFTMGNPLERYNSTFNDSAHLVAITHDFWIGQTEVTRAQWEKVMGKNELHPDKSNPFHKDDPNYPIVCISYFEAQDFLKKLEELTPGNHFRLPTEAEWEYACRAGTTTTYSFGDSITDDQAKFWNNNNPENLGKSRFVGHPEPVKSYPPNPWGLYDMHGNVWEWVSDWYGPYPIEHVIDPQGSQTGEMKVIRGGSWCFSKDKAQSHTRMIHRPFDFGFSIGFRVVREKKGN